MLITNALLKGLRRVSFAVTSQVSHSISRRSGFAAALLAFGLFQGPIQAQSVADWPNRPIRIIVPYTPGGSTDVAARIVMDKLSVRLKQSIIIENKPGANGNVGATLAARSEPDGYTFVSVLAAYSVNPHLYNMPFTPDALVPVTKMAALPLFLFINNALPVKTVQELIAYGKANPGKLNYASSGTGSSAHMTGTNFSLLSDIQTQHIPYKGSVPILADLLSGELSFCFDTMVVFMPQVKENKLRVLAVTSARRWPSEPNIPTMQESGFPGFEMGSWTGLMAPKGTPKAIIDKMAAEIKIVLSDPEVQQKYLNAGFIAEPSTPAQFGELIERDGAMYGGIIKAAKISAN
jgi:tripartite-type tricarboxylate transporter receptor subunit TctC